MPTDDRFVGRKQMVLRHCGESHEGTLIPRIKPPGSYFVTSFPADRLIETPHTSQDIVFRLVGLVECTLGGEFSSMVGLFESFYPKGEFTSSQAIRGIYTDDLPQYRVDASIYPIWERDPSFPVIYSCFQDDMGNPPTPPTQRFGVRAASCISFNYPVSSVADIQWDNASGNTIKTLPSFNPMSETPFLYFEADGLTSFSSIPKYGVSVFSLHGLRDINIAEFNVSLPDTEEPNRFYPIIPNPLVSDGGHKFFYPPYPRTESNFIYRQVTDKLYGILIWSTPTANIYLVRLCEYKSWFDYGEDFELIPYSIARDLYCFVSDATTDMEEVI